MARRGFCAPSSALSTFPVVHDHRGGDALPHFSTHHLHLSHGDDPYNQLTFTDPQYSMSELLLDQATYDNWFGSGVSDADKLKHVGKRTEELAIEYLPGYVLRAYCSDKANGKTHANGTVNGGRPHSELSRWRGTSSSFLSSLLCRAVFSEWRTL